MCFGTALKDLNYWALMTDNGLVVSATVRSLKSEFDRLSKLLHAVHILRYIRTRDERLLIKPVSLPWISLGKRSSYITFAHFSFN